MKIKQQRKTRNYFESIYCKVESTQKITDVKLHQGNLEDRLFETRKRKMSRLALKMILSPYGFEIPFLESLILAQDERWRRA